MIDAEIRNGLVDLHHDFDIAQGQKISRMTVDQACGTASLVLELAVEVLPCLGLNLDLGHPETAQKDATVKKLGEVNKPTGNHAKGGIEGRKKKEGHLWKQRCRRKGANTNASKVN